MENEWLIREKHAHRSFRLSAPRKHSSITLANRKIASGGSPSSKRPGKGVAFRSVYLRHNYPSDELGNNQTYQQAEVLHAGSSQYLASKLGDSDPSAESIHLQRCLWLLALV
uniref:Uncharacterized protein n=1 Tax=Hyaloperonospora arabidopsidis (strain Emoy2) TaxID=559515 RepID=M4BM25_HYAAE